MPLTLFLMLFCESVMPPYFLKFINMPQSKMQKFSTPVDNYLDAKKFSRYLSALHVLTNNVPNC